jgi:hypothetical protein
MDSTAQPLLLAEREVSTARRADDSDDDPGVSDAVAAAVGLNWRRRHFALTTLA